MAFRGAATGTVVNSGGLQVVDTYYTGPGSPTVFAIVSFTTVNSGGLLDIRGGGIVTDVTQNSGGVLIANNNAFITGSNALGSFSVNNLTRTASNLLLENGGRFDSYNAVTTSTTVNNKGSLSIIGGEASATLVNSGDSVIIFK